MQQTLSQAFRAHMRLAELFRRVNSERATVGRAAIVALERARADLDAGRHSPAMPSQFGSAGAPFAAYGERQMRWIENPESAGLRFVGLASDLCRLGHDGWFLDRDFQDETVRGVVYQLPGRNGSARCVAGVADPHQSDKQGRGPALLSFDAMWECPSDDEIADVARMADEIARLYAEKEWAYREAFNAGSHWSMLGNEIADLRKATLRLFRELKHARKAFPSADDLHGLCRVVREKIESNVDSIRKYRAERDTLWNGDSRNYSYRHMGKDSLIAFNEGAGIQA